MGERRLTAVTFLGVLAFMACGREAAPPVDLRVDLSERVNAVYHVACLADSITCAKNVFERFWKERLDWDDSDAAAVAAWRDAMSTLTRAAPPRAPALLLPNTQRFHPGQAARTAAIVAAVASDSAPDLTRRSGGVVVADMATALMNAVDHVEARLRTWFRTTGRPRVEARVAEVTSRARQSGFNQTATRMTAFLEAQLPEPTLYVHAIAGPEPASDEFSATQVGSHFFLEVVDAVRPDDVVSGAVHELTHYIYDRAPPDKQRQLIGEFVASGAASHAGLYTYLNEAIAISAHGLHAKRNGHTSGDDQAYRHPYIAPLGEATVPLVTSAIGRNASLFDAFVPAYIAAGTAVLKEKIREPRFVLAQVGLLLSDRPDAARAAYFRNMLPQASAQFRSEEEMAAFPELHVVRFVRYDDLGSWSARSKRVEELQARRGFAYALPRGRTSRTFLFAGRDDGSIVEVIERFANLEALPEDGLVLSVD